MTGPVTTPLTRMRRRTAALLATALSGALVLSGCSVYDAPLPGGPDTGKDPMKVTLMFRDVLDLVPQSTVKVNDVTVGKVTSVELKGYLAKVTIELPTTVDLPENTRAQIRQTSLLGEKFISLDAPQSPASGKLSDKDVIGLDGTGRNPEVEEVLGALSLLLNGGGVGQLKTIAQELNTTFDGRETELRSVLTQIRTFTGQLDRNKAAIIAAIENTNRLAAQVRKQDRTVRLALDEIPDTLRSVNRQRDDLVKLLAALNRLSGVGTRVIQASRESTINSLRDLGPVLQGFADAGQNFPKAFQVYLTYPFVDEAVGRDPQVASNLHMGDYTNLSVDLDVDLLNLPLPGLPGLPPEVCEAVAAIRQQVRQGASAAADAIVKPLEDGGVPSTVTRPVRRELRARILNEFLAEAVRQCQVPNPADLLAFGQGQLEDVIAELPQRLRQILNAVPGVGDVVGDIVEQAPTAPGLGGVTGGLGSGSGTGGGGLGLPRPAPGDADREAVSSDPFGLARYGLDPDLGTLLLQGVADVR